MPRSFIALTSGITFATAIFSGPATQTATFSPPNETSRYSISNLRPSSISKSLTQDQAYNTLPPAVVAAPVERPASTAPPDSTVSYPVELYIPSIEVDSKIEYMGINEKGEMNVPDGLSDHVGWYKYGTIPGDVGSAVVDAHVFAAFAKLKNLQPGDDIYVQTASNKKLHFMISEIQVYPLGAVPLQKLFNRSDGRRLNLITCAGNLVPDHSTYDHRLVVYATLIK